MLQSKVFLIHNYLCIFDTAKIIINILIYKHLRLFNPTVVCFSFLQLAVFHSYSWLIFIPTVGRFSFHHLTILYSIAAKSCGCLLLTPIECWFLLYLNGHPRGEWMTILVMTGCPFLLCQYAKTTPRILSTLPADEMPAPPVASVFTVHF